MLIITKQIDKGWCNACETRSEGGTYQISQQTISQKHHDLFNPIMVICKDCLSKPLREAIHNPLKNI